MTKTEERHIRHILKNKSVIRWNAHRRNDGTTDNERMGQSIMRGRLQGRAKRKVTGGWMQKRMDLQKAECGERDDVLF